MGALKTDIILPLYQRIVSHVTTLLNRLDVNEEYLLAEVDELKQQLSMSGTGQIDYDRLALPFFHRYFLANFWKAVLCFHEQAPIVAQSFIDVGCGSGATSLAYLAWLESNAPKSRLQVEALLIDRSTKQISLSRLLLEELSSKFQCLDVNFKFQNLDLGYWQPDQNAAELVLFGHVLTENRSHIKSLLEKALLACTEQGNIYVIEHIDDDVWYILNNLIPQLALPTSQGAVDSRSLKLKNKLPAVQKAEVAGRYLTIRVPQPKQVVDLLKLYFRAWEQQSTELLDELFTVGAQYYTKPHDPPLQGIDQIKSYWITNVIPQRKIDIRLLRVAYEARYAFAEWHAHFILNGQEIDLRGALILEFNRAIDRVVTLREYYHTFKRGSPLS